MKPAFTRIILFTMCMVFSMYQAKAAIYTANNSGNFTSSATWAGGNVPPANLAADNIIINSGVTVTLDVNLIVNGMSSLLQLYGNGKIQGTGNFYIAFNAGQATSDLTSSIDVDSIVIGNTALISFYGTIAANSVTLAGPNLPSTFTISAREILALTTSNTGLSSGTTINLGGSTPVPTIIMAGGDLMMVPGVNFSLTSPYHVKYASSNNIIGNGFELTGSGLTNIEIAVGSGQTISLGNNFTINGILKLSSGSLSLQSHTLSLAGTSSIDATGSGTIIGDNSSSIIITSSTPAVGTLKFATNGGMLKNLIMNAAGSEIKIDDDLTIDSSLRLLSGNINIQGNTMTVSQMQGVVVGGSANSYVITETGGVLRLPIADSSIMTYHVGHAGGYAPVAITNKNGSIYPEFGIHVQQEVKIQGTTGPDMSSVEPLVKTSWITSHTGSQTAKYDIEVMWNAAAEVNGFNRAESNVAFYSGGKWTRNITTAATNSGSMYAQKKEGANGFGAHTVFDLQTLGVTDLVTGTIIAAYPNPATTVLNFDLKSFDNVQATIYSTTGQVISTAALNVTNNTMNVEQLPQGMYYVQLHGNNFNGTAKFVKQ